MLGIYFSGTGNTKHCVETFIKQYDSTATSLSIENPDVLKAIATHDTIVFGYPVYFSCLPKIVSDFITNHKTYFYHKKIYIIATMSLFSGDGTGCSARLLKKCSATILGGLHLKMPDCIGDEKLLKRSLEKNRELITKADQKIILAVSKLKKGRPHKEGLGLFYHIAGLFGQRLWFYGFYKKTLHNKSNPTIDSNKCIDCGLCASLCPTKNITIKEEKAVSTNHCTLCYRCFSHCPTKALTILGKEVYEQCLFEKYH